MVYDIGSYHDISGDHVRQHLDAFGAGILTASGSSYVSDVLVS